MKRAVAVTLAEQIAEARRELAISSGFYSRKVKAGQMTAGEAFIHLARKKATLETLEELSRNLPFSRLTRLRSIDAELGD